MTEQLPKMIPAQLAEDAYVRIDTLLPAIRAGAEALGLSDEAQALWAASFLLEAVSEKLGAATGWC